MAEPAADEKPPATVPVVPSAITAPQIIALLLALAALRYGREFLAPLLVAVLAAVALAPPVRALSRAMRRGPVPSGNGMTFSTFRVAVSMQPTAPLTCEYHA